MEIRKLKLIGIGNKVIKLNVLIENIRSRVVRWKSITRCEDRTFETIQSDKCKESQEMMRWLPR